MIRWSPIHLDELCTIRKIWVEPSWHRTVTCPFLFLLLHYSIISFLLKFDSFLPNITTTTFQLFSVYQHHYISQYCFPSTTTTLSLFWMFPLPWKLIVRQNMRSDSINISLEETLRSLEYIWTIILWRKCKCFVKENTYSKMPSLRRLKRYLIKKLEDANNNTNNNNSWTYCAELNMRMISCASQLHYFKRNKLNIMH